MMARLCSGHYLRLMRTITRNILLLLWLLALSAWVQAAQSVAPQPEAPLTEEFPAYTIEQVQGCIEQVLPLVERITGRKLAQVPPARLVTREEFDRATRRSSGRRSRSGRANTPSMAHYALGAYDESPRALYFFPGNFAPRLRAAGVPESYSSIILKMVVAHELTHALQDQEAGISKVYRRARSKEAMFAHRATVEGHATFVMGMVAEALGHPKAMEQFEKTISVGLSLLPGEKNVEANDELRREMRSAYIDGSRFIRWQYAMGGNELVWRTIESPPSTRKEILEPGSYPGRSGSAVTPAVPTPGQRHALAPPLVVVRMPLAQDDAVLAGAGFPRSPLVSSDTGDKLLSDAVVSHERHGGLP